MTSNNQCGGCTACCRIVPIGELGIKKYAGCPHVRPPWHAAGPGCGVPTGYERRPYSCKAWSCLWLRSEWAPELRPDRLGIVVDENMDLIEVDGFKTPAAQIWVLPGHEDDWQKPEPNNIIMTFLLQERVAVLWILPPGDNAIVFWRHPKTGALIRSAPHPCAPNADAVLGSAPERMLRAGDIYQRSAKHRRSPR
jgi:hypothetical protein